MKRFKRIIFNILAVVLVFGTCLGLTACEDIKRLEVTFSVYDADEEAVVEKTLTVDLYRHLAPTTVDHIINNCVNKSYYNNAILYKENNGIMMGDIFFDTSSDGFVKKSQTIPTVEGEFERGGTIGSNLEVNVGSVALWRTWGVNDGMDKNSGFDTGRATWFMPTSSQASYKGLICVFGQFDTSSETWIDVKAALDNTELTSEQYTIYYTGTYDADAVDCGLTFHCVKTEELPEGFGEDDYFTPEEGTAQLVEYKKREITIPYFGNSLALSIKSIKLV